MARHLRLGGIVQGVGFRPFVHRLAQRHGLAGWVRNEAGQVEILVQGAEPALEAFCAALLRDAPPAAKPVLLASISAPDKADRQFADRQFLVRESREGTRISGVPADLGPCAACLAELADPADRRFNYPFINCTQCGPRFSIISALPYDRANTSMAGFAMCADCAGEYADPADRRFHAEAIACPACGPKLRYGALEGEAALAACVTDLRAQKIVAVKGVGGYHLFCDAADAATVARLRTRKHRPEKPLALLLPETLIRRYAAFGAAELSVLRAPARPILLLRRSKNAALADNIAPGLDEIGVMLPDSPLHHLLAQRFGRALVATSANRSGAPMPIEARAAERELQNIADGFLHHDRPILRPLDDSLLRMIAGAARPVRLGRGFAPLEFSLPPAARRVLALGGQQKVTVALAADQKCFVSPHLGTLDNPDGFARFVATIEDLRAFYGIRADQTLGDAHPAYAGSRWARANQEFTPVAHHFAHASALAGEHELWRTEMLAFTWDAIGLGAAQKLWGGEVLRGHPGHWRVVARLRPIRLQGGDAVARAPWRAGAALCWHCATRPPDFLAVPELARLAWEGGENCVEFSSAGRLFDGAAALLGLVREASYEGQGPMRLEALAGDAPGEADALPMTRQDGVWQADWAPLVAMLLDETRPPSVRARMFHDRLAATILAIAREQGVENVGLCGGVFQNRRLCEAAARGLGAAGFFPRLARRLPCNDAGLSFGQIVEFRGGEPKNA